MYIYGQVRIRSPAMILCCIIVLKNIVCYLFFLKSLILSIISGSKEEEKGSKEEEKICEEGKCKIS